MTPTAAVFKGAATSLIAPGTEGYFGVLPGHTPFITSLTAGTLTYLAGGERREYHISAGYAEVTPTSVIILTEEAVPVEEAA